MQRHPVTRSSVLLSGIVIVVLVLVAAAVVVDGADLQQCDTTNGFGCGAYCRIFPAGIHCVRACSTNPCSLGYCRVVCADDDRLPFCERVRNVCG